MSNVQAQRQFKNGNLYTPVLIDFNEKLVGDDNGVKVVIYNLSEFRGDFSRVEHGIGDSYLIGPFRQGNQFVIVFPLWKP